MKGIIVRSGEKASLTDIKEAEIVYATDTKEIGIKIGSEIIWEEWVLEFPDRVFSFGKEAPGTFDDYFLSEGDIYVHLNNNEFVFYLYREGSFENLGKVYTEMLTEQEADGILEPDWHSEDNYPYLGKYSYTLSLEQTVDKSLATFGRAKSLMDPGSVTMFEFKMDEEYEAKTENDIMTVKDVQKKLYHLLPYPRFEVGAIWYDENVIMREVKSLDESFFNGYKPMIFKVLTNSAASSSSVFLVYDDVTDSWVQKNLELGRKYFIAFAYGQYSIKDYIDVKEITIYENGDRTSYSMLFKDLSNMSIFDTYSKETTKNITDFNSAWEGCTNMFFFPQLDVSNGTNFDSTWMNCSDLTSFPELDVSNGTNFDFAWGGCYGLTSFPQLDVSNGTTFKSAWSNTKTLTSFPQLDVSSGTNFRWAWDTCSSLTSFPQLDVSNGTDFYRAWASCSSLTSFPQLDVSSGTDFSYAWYDCIKLPHCPAGNEVTIPSSAITTDMCGGTCCTG